MVSSRNSEGVLDPKMTEKPTSRALKKALLVALRCVDPEARKRPKIGHVIHMLEVDDFPYRDVSLHGMTFFLSLFSSTCYLVRLSQASLCIFYFKSKNDIKMNTLSIIHCLLLHYWVTHFLYCLLLKAPFCSLSYIWWVDTSFLGYTKYGFVLFCSRLNLLRCVAVAL
jgi:hypothetical protein